MGRKKILFIDDDADYIESTKLFLEKKYEVITAYDAEEGFKKIGKEKPDLILLDAMMPGKDGFIFAKELKTHPDYKNIPIIMLTGVVPIIFDTKYSPEDILRFEGDDFVEKSAGIEEIMSTVKRHIG
ncbi:MAG: response regulator [Elusimicrobiota bacterium]